MPVSLTFGQYHQLGNSAKRIFASSTTLLRSRTRTNKARSDIYCQIYAENFSFGKVTELFMDKKEKHADHDRSPEGVNDSQPDKLPHLATNGPHNPVRRKSGMYLELLEAEDEDELLQEEINSSRRPSTCSLSRYRSCPQLAPAHEQVSPGCEVMSIEGESPLPIVHSTSPLIRRRLHINENGRRSATPTPPSTPGSKRSPISFKESQSERMQDLSPASTPKLGRHSKKDFGLLGRTSSGDSANQDHLLFSSAGIPLKEENIHRFDELQEKRFKHHSDLLEGPPEINIEEKLSETEEDDSRSCPGHHHRRRHRHHTTDESYDKCERWLQSLKISRGDRIKSRSHIQLPPI